MYSVASPRAWLLAGVVTLLVLAVAAVVPAASAQQTPTYSYTTAIAPLNGSGVSGSVMVTAQGTTATVVVHARGLSPYLAHPQHLHIGADFTCPGAAADVDENGWINDRESEQVAGPPKVSLTASGAVTPDAATDVLRFPKADANGMLDYSRTFELPYPVTASDLQNAVYEIHGLDMDNSSAYDGARNVLHQYVTDEAMTPVGCGDLSSAPAPTVTARPSITNPPARTPTATTAPTGTAAPTGTETATPTATGAPTGTETGTPTGTATATATPTSAPASSGSSTATPTPTPSVVGAGVGATGTVAAARQNGPSRLPNSGGDPGSGNSSWLLILGFGAALCIAGGGALAASKRRF